LISTLSPTFKSCVKKVPVPLISLQEELTEAVPRIRLFAESTLTIAPVALTEATMAAAC
jgi:hypothetical protein